MAQTDVAGRAPAVRTLDGVVDGLADGVSPSRARQLRMVAAMWGRALEHWPDGVTPPARSGELFGDEALRTFWRLATTGRLWMRERDVGKAPSGATLRIVRDCLGILAAEVCPGEAVWLPTVAQPEPKAVVPPAQLPVLYRKLADMASDAPVERGGIALSKEDRVRLLALVAVVLDTGARSSELAAMRLDDLGAGEGTVWVRRSPQNASDLPQRVVAGQAGVGEDVVHRVMTGRGGVAPGSRAKVLAALERLGEGGPAVERYALRPGTAVALRQWLRVRAGLVARLQGTQSALWVSLKANQWQGEPGFALRPQGIRKAYTRGAVALNGLMAGRYGWSPLPTTLEQLRRTVDVEPDRPAPHGGGTA
ncbi:hypothetical protein [Actinacidiphila acidipaludis]|uniref:Tyr recombinase domain-containing protein n=1 Tax=Actinacidiphila acidipaludis TaxID=2873382 RepID=A0ABS7QJ04_9ACTN|nr:hypothetical protein [Streptomyces acidipaludis]MBY8883148.1 hypothetical protein [Streptomyces acidipaludis]